ncbi:hypothetical protein [Rhodococcus sp. P1Y]|uniref:hypothetical protein n=1 Tax=Rhodococcus sp. P1Y TaxID=1302308 RepID=UPI000EB364CA|nr:hypothetical protein [Rhodococcus sp. P1Y]AYJ50325.1 hypothetical protein D8W71_20855 [Rhodococcus sp. P1Y]
MMSAVSNHTMTEVDRDLMIDFARRWLHYGGGSASDIFVQFGVSDTIFFERLADVVEHTDRLSEPARRELIALCARRLDRKKASTGRAKSRRRKLRQ